MKKILLSALALLIACKKEEEPPTHPPTPAPTEKQVSVKVNGSLYTCDICANTYYSGGLHGVNISETGTSNRMVFNFDTVPSTGTHTLEKFGATSLTYEKNGYYYRGRGVINISAISTGSSGGINMLKATFEAQTDTASDNSHYSLTEGSINIK